MKEIVSKELLSEVLGQKVIQIKKVKEQWSMQVLPIIAIEEFERRGLNLSREEQYFFNIYELAHKCKEWVLENGITTINSGTCRYREMRLTPEEIHTQSYCDISKGLSTHKWIGSTQGYHGNRFYADTEPEAIFKACQWILENKG